MYWFEKLQQRSYPELAHFETCERWRALRRAHKSVGREVRYLVMFAGVVLLVCLVLGVMLVQSPSWDVPVALLGAMSGAGPVLLLVRIRRPFIRRALRAQLLVVGIPLCTHCGYDLRGQLEPRCPECGRAFDRTLIRETAKRSDSGTG